MNHPLDRFRGHKLLPNDLEKTIPMMNSEQCAISDKERRVPVKFFSPYSNWTWYVLEYDPETREFFGLVCGLEKEFGYFSFDELAGASRMGGKLPLIERDCHWDPKTTLAEVKAAEGVQ